MIPFVDLSAQYQAIKPEIDNAISSVIADNAFIGTGKNKYIQAFESGFNSYIGINHTIACANGTDAIEIALQALGVGPGDEVLVPAMSWIASSEAISTCGGTPIFVDINSSTGVLDETKIEAAITNKTKGIVVVHLYGNPCEMDEIMAIANNRGLFVLEDCAQAHGATYKGKTVGTFGTVSTYSYYPGKNLGAYGDAGSIITNDDDLAQLCRVIANHGQLGQKHNHISEGRNSRMDGIQAAILSVKLKYIRDWTKLRQEKAAYYREHINHTDVKCLELPEYSASAYHLFVIKSSRRAELISALSENKIAYGIHYPVSLPLLKPYAGNANINELANRFPVASEFQNQILSLPLYPEITKQAQDEVIKTISSL